MAVAQQQPAFSGEVEHDSRFASHVASVCTNALRGMRAIGDETLTECHDLLRGIIDRKLDEWPCEVSRSPGAFKLRSHLAVASVNAFSQLIQAMGSGEYGVIRYTDGKRRLVVTIHEDNAESPVSRLERVYGILHRMRQAIDRYRSESHHNNWLALQAVDREAEDALAQYIGRREKVDAVNAQLGPQAEARAEQSRRLAVEGKSGESDCNRAYVGYLRTCADKSRAGGDQYKAAKFDLIASLIVEHVL